MSENPMKKLGELKIVTGEYTDQGGKTKKRYQSVGAVFGTPHHSRLSVKFYATAFSDERWANLYYDDGCEPQKQSDAQERHTAPDSVDTPIDLSEVEF